MPFFLLNFICIERNCLIKKKVKQNEQVNDLASNFSKILPKTIEPNDYFSRKINSDSYDSINNLLECYLLDFDKFKCEIKELYPIKSRNKAQ